MGSKFPSDLRERFAFYPLNCVTDKLRTRSKLQLDLQMLAVRVDRLHAEIEFGGDLPAAESVSDQLKYFHLTITQTVDRKSNQLILLVQHSVQDSILDLRA